MCNPQAKILVKFKSIPGACQESEVHHFMRRKCSNKSEYGGEWMPHGVEKLTCLIE